MEYHVELHLCARLAVNATISSDLAPMSSRAVRGSQIGSSGCVLGMWHSIAASAPAHRTLRRALLAIKPTEYSTDFP
jgi:hypothetical protein